MPKPTLRGVQLIGCTTNVTIASDDEILVLLLPETPAAVADDEVAKVTVTELFDDDTRGVD